MKLAVKRLKQSDLSFFAARYRLSNVSHQKALNLNRAVLVDAFYPDLAEIFAKSGPIPISLSIWGPGGAPELNLKRSITREAKNWRLNGEVIHNPEKQENRFDNVEPGDLAVLRFDGPGRPEAVQLVLISATLRQDAELHRALSQRIGPSMTTFDANALGGILELSPADHPARLLVIDESTLADIEDAAMGDVEASQRLMATRTVAQDELDLARLRASEIGADGESLVSMWLEGRFDDGDEVTWISRINAVAPFDFEINSPDREPVCIEVKSTTGPMSRPFHISIAEIAAAANRPRYDLYRVYDLTEEGAKLSITRNISSWANSILGALKALPYGVWPQSFRIDPSLFDWSQPVELVASSDEDDDIR